MLRSLLVSALVISGACAPIIRHSSIPESLERLDASSLGPSERRVLALPMWRGHDCYFLGTPWLGTVGALPTLRSQLDVFHRIQFVDIIGQRYGGVPWIHGIYLLTEQGDLVHLIIDWGRNPEKGWVVEARAILGHAWREQLVSQLSADGDISLVGDYLADSFWRFHNEFDCGPGAVQEDKWAVPGAYPKFVADYCSTLRLRLPWSRDDHINASQFVESIPATEIGSTDEWATVNEPVAAGTMSDHRGMGHNNRLQVAAGGLGGNGPARRAFARRT